jgi:LDH2 family malate/lactate/ureidoglycolate dehydrogenase
VIDADATLGQVGASASLQIAVDAADARGLGMCICRNTSHVGALGPYLMQAVRGRAVLALTNTAASVAPPGGNFAAIGNNCIGFAAPIRGAAPRCLDMTTSYESWGKIRDRIDRGESLPPGVALAPDGSWAVDPAVAVSHTVAAALGGAKGFGLAMMIDIITGGLGGGELSPKLKLLRDVTAEPEGTCCAFLAMSLQHFPGGRALPGRLAAWRGAIKAGKRAGKSPILLPGERAHREENDCKKHGLPVAPVLKRELIGLADRLRMAHPF